MRRRKMDGLPCGRQPLDISHEAVAADRLSGLSLTETAKRHGISRATVVRFCREARLRGVTDIEADQQTIECAA
jgi:DNA-binding transcriptional regulator LsrR (DeoR family)